MNVAINNNEERRGSAVVTISVPGPNLDTVKTQELRESINSKCHGEQFILDFENVEFIDSCGLGFLRSLTTGQESKRFYCCSLNPRTLRIMERIPESMRLESFENHHAALQAILEEETSATTIPFLVPSNRAS